MLKRILCLRVLTTLQYISLSHLLLPTYSPSLGISPLFDSRERQERLGERGGGMTCNISPRPDWKPPGRPSIPIHPSCPQYKLTLWLNLNSLSLSALLRYWQERHLRPDRHATGRLPNDVGGPVLPQAAEHHGQCAAFPAGLRSNEGAVRGRIHRGASGLRGPGMTETRNVLF